MKNLFENTTIKNMKLKNRFFKGATWEALADDKGHMTEELYDMYEEFAKGGVGTIITSYTYVTENEKPNPKMLGIYDDSFIEEYKKLTDLVHNYNSNIIMEIVYGGSQTKYTDKEVFGPSSVENQVSKVTPKEMTKEDIDYIVNAYGDAALRVKKSGFDGVELHAGHGYFLNHFLSPYYNRRTDKYGGEIENRARIIFEIYENIRSKAGEEFPILIKINSEDFAEGGLTRRDSLYVCRRLSEMGIDAIEVSGGNESFNEVWENDNKSVRSKVPGVEFQPHFKDFAEELSKQITTPVILVSGNRSINGMEEILNESNVQYFALARPLNSEPDLINKWEKNPSYKVRCISCNKCFDVDGHRCVLNLKK
ncbi:NADPH dehydrogenase [Clostridium sp. DL-VIII]|uniref:NADH:flavin oxidoreductase n=1 Tax=Clostridium sp. DL-VIII TaxID=641107 RepID=UPI00023AFDCC|nr:NADH:flavin oxidoreductase [Clostridium sp. DL-VIII]EHI98400.1 NADPH dehydrogenase [Clostridium sp. DL-VIII]